MPNKTQLTIVDPADFVDTIESEAKRSDARVLVELMRAATGCEPKMWGASIVGFGRYHYKYESGREGEFMLVGFSPRKAKHSLYIMAGFESVDDIMARLGKYKTGKSCLYVNKLADIDLVVLRELIDQSLVIMRERYSILEG